MQTITGKLSLAGESNVAASTTFQIQMRNNTQGGVVVASFISAADGTFSFQIEPGTYFFRLGNDALPFEVKETSGTTTINNVTVTL